MKLALILGVALAGVIGSIVLLKPSPPPVVTITTDSDGLASLKVDRTDFLQTGRFGVAEVLLKDPSGATHWGQVNGTSALNSKQNELTTTYPWGTVKTKYVASGNKLTLSITTTNSSDTDTIQGIRYIPLVLKFPDKVKEYDGSTPLLMHNIGQVAEVTVSYDSGTLAIVSEDLAKPLMIGFPWAFDKPSDTVFPLSIHTDRVASYPDSYPRIVRPISPKGCDQYVVSLRFGRSKATETALAGDIDKKYATAFPQQLHWSDRRPVGAIFLATNAEGWPGNPRGWFGDAKLNINTPQGKAQFRERLLQLADGSINIMRDMNAQGAITWDIEGQDQRTSPYVGDPRLISKVAPEMDEIADEYFARFKAAGLRTGVCVRPQSLQMSADDKTSNQVPVDDPAALLIDKIAYAKKRWGVSLIYIDSNVNGTDPNPLDASVIQKVAEAFPDCLLVPEHSTLRYYAYSAPFEELKRGIVSTPDVISDIYPKAFSLIYTADGPLDMYRNNLKASVKRGDALMYRTWFYDPQNDKVKAIYRQ